MRGSTWNFTRHVLGHARIEEWREASKVNSETGRFQRRSRDWTGTKPTVLGKISERRRWQRSFLQELDSIVHQERRQVGKSKEANDMRLQRMMIVKSHETILTFVP